MRTTILSLVLASIAGLVYCGEESLAGFGRRSQQCRTCCPVIIERRPEIPPAVQDSEDPELRALLEARRDALKEVVRLVDVRFQSGTITDVERHISEIVESGGRGGGIGREVGRGVGPEDLLIATAARIKAEIDLRKARKKAK